MPLRKTGMKRQLYPAGELICSTAVSNVPASIGQQPSLDTGLE